MMEKTNRLTMMLNKIDPPYRERLADPLWRLNNLYWIENKRGSMQRFTPNVAQLRLHRHLWHRNVVLKAQTEDHVTAQFGQICRSGDQLIHNLQFGFPHKGHYRILVHILGKIIFHNTFSVPL